MTNTQRIFINAEKLRKLAGEGRTDREISKIMGVSPKVIGTRRREQGILAGVGMHGKKTVDIERIRELALLGWSDRLIGIELGRTENLIRTRRHEAGIEPGNPHKRSTWKPAGPKDENPLQGYSSVRRADAEFARLIGDQKFTDVRLKQSPGPIAKPLHRSLDMSFTGCAAGMCAR